MVQQVHTPEQLAVMHKAVHPVEIAIVDEEHERKGQEKIKPSVLLDARIKTSGCGNGRHMEDAQRHQGEYGSGECGVADLALVIFSAGHALLDLFMENFPFQQHIEQ